jgi:hypothetical protein
MKVLQGVSSLHTLRTMLLLLIPSKTHVLSMGTYCSVMTLMTSCDTIPPVNAPMLCISAPPARTLVNRQHDAHRSRVVLTYSSLVNSPICVLTAAYSSSSTVAFASLTRSSAILKAMPVSFSVSMSWSASPATRGAPPSPSFSCVAVNASHARKAMYNGTSESGNVSV